MINSNVDLNRVRTFLQIIDAGNLTKAAAVLNERKSKLSRDLAFLESDLKVQLVYRTTRQFQLTDAGRDFYRKAKDSLLILNSAVEDLKTESADVSGVIRITASEDVGNFVLNPILMELKNKYPKVIFDLVYTNQVLDLTATATDIAIRIGVLKDSNLIQRKIGAIDAVLVASADFLDQHPELTEVDQMADLPTVVFGNRSKKTFWNLSSGKERKRIPIKPSWIANNFVTVREYVLNSQGIGFMPRFLVVDEIQSGKLIHIFKNWTDQPIPIQMVFPNQNETSARIKLVSDFILKRLRDLFL